MACFFLDGMIRGEEDPIRGEIKTYGNCMVEFMVLAKYGWSENEEI